MSRVWSGSTANYLAPTANAVGDFPTVAAWVKCHAYPTGGASVPAPIAGQWGGGFLNSSELLLVTNLGRLGYEVMIPPASIVGSTNVVPLDQWCHVCGSYDGTVRVYINGALEGSLGVGGSTVAGGGTWRIGYSPEGPWAFNGEIENVGLWQRRLSDAEIASLAGGLSPSRITNGLLSHMPIWGQESPEPELRRGAPANIVGTLPAGSPPLPNVGSPFSAAG